MRLQDQPLYVCRQVRNGIGVVFVAEKRGWTAFGLAGRPFPRRTSSREGKSYEPQVLEGTCLLGWGGQGRN